MWITCTAINGTVLILADRQCATHYLIHYKSSYRCCCDRLAMTLHQISYSLPLAKELGIAGHTVGPVLLLFKCSHAKLLQTERAYKMFSVVLSSHGCENAAWCGLLALIAHCTAAFVDVVVLLTIWLPVVLKKVAISERLTTFLKKCKEGEEFIWLLLLKVQISKWNLWGQRAELQDGKYSWGWQTTKLMVEVGQSLTIQLKHSGCHCCPRAVTNASAIARLQAPHFGANRSK